MNKSCTLTLDQIKNIFSKHTVTSVIQCAGNRRDDFNEVNYLKFSKKQGLKKQIYKQIKEVKGVPWGAGAIGNAQWSGAKLVDVLQYCGCNLTDDSIEHVQFEGLDLNATATPYGASVPAEKVRNEKGKK